MSMSERSLRRRFAAPLAANVAMALAAASAAAQEGPGLGVEATPEQVEAWSLTVLPDGTGLPPGSGTARAGAAIYAQKCLGCHGAEGKDGPNDRLAGGHGTLADAAPVKTVGSYWPYATTVFDYIRRAMPFTQPQSLSSDEIYALTAYLLYINDVVGQDEVIDSRTLPAVEMPNRANFYWAWGATSGPEAQASTGTELLDGSLDGWTVVDTQSDNFRIEGGVLRVEGSQGWLRSQSSYADFELTVEFRFLTDDADSGIFFRAVGTEPFARGWPNRSYQLQMLNPASASRFPPIGSLFRHGMPNADTRFDEPLARRTSRPTGEWQTLVIRVSGETVEASLNDVKLLEADGVGNGSGHIGIQGESGALEFRSLRLRQL